MIFKTNFSSVFILHWIKLSEIKTGHDPCLDARRKTYRLEIQQLLHVRLVVSLLLFFSKQSRTLIKYGSKCRIIEINSFQ